MTDEKILNWDMSEESPVDYMELFGEIARYLIWERDRYMKGSIIWRQYNECLKVNKELLDSVNLKEK